MAATQTIRRFGVPAGAPGIRVIENSGSNALSDPQYGTCFFLGVLKRGPMGVAIPVTNKRQYDTIFGDPKNSRWHLFPDGSQLTPDAVDGFYTTGGGAGTLWLTRLSLDGKARKASVVLKNRVGSDALRITAANEGRWGGYDNALPASPVIAATVVTFTLIAPGVLADEYKDAIAEISGAAGKSYVVVSNTAADPISNQATFVIGSQYDLIADGVSGPTTLTGLATYAPTVALAGTVEFPATVSVTGTATLNGRIVQGVGTTFIDDLKVGSNIYYQNQARVVQTIASDTTLTIAEPFVIEGSGVTLQTDNFVVTGTGSSFTSKLVPGKKVYATINGVPQARTVASVTSDTEFVLTSGWTTALAALTTISTDNLTLTGTGTAFTTELQVGDYLFNPALNGQQVRVASIQSATSLTLAVPFNKSFATAQLIKQAQTAVVNLTQPAGEGLAVQVGQGSRYPDTHFSLTVSFNGSTVVSVDDASLDPNDPYFVDPLINNLNVAYQDSSGSYQTWITAENLWHSAYTTNSSFDVRPANGSGIAVALEKSKLFFSDTNISPSDVVGNLLYPDPYTLPRGYVRVKQAQQAVAIAGTISSSGVTVTGTSTVFTSALSVGDYIYDPGSKTARKVAQITSDTSLLLSAPFASNLSAVHAIKAGWLQAEQSYDLTLLTQVGYHFLLVFPVSLTGGYDGDTAAIIPYYYTRYADGDANFIENATFGKNLGLIRIACPGVSDQTIQKAFLNYAALKAYEYRVEIPSSYNTAATAEYYIKQVVGQSDFASVAFPSYGYISNINGYGTRLVSLSGDIMGGESLQAVNNRGYHVPFSGVNAIMSRVLQLPFAAYPNDDAILNTAGIQTIKNVYGNIVVYGARVPSVSPTYDFLHVRRIQSNLVRVFLEARTLLQLIFQPNQPQLSEQIVMTLNNFARSEYKKGVFSQYLSFSQAVQTGSTIPTNSTSSVDTATSDGIVTILNGQLSVFFRYVPTGILETLSIEAGPDILVAQYGSTVNKNSTVG